MIILLFGNYIADYPRIQVLKKGLKDNNVKILECHTRKSGLVKYWDLAKQHKQYKNQYDILIIGMGGYTLVWLARLLSRKKIVFDAFVSQYLTNVEDRQKVSAKSFKARYYVFLDKYSCKLADIVLLDTQAQIDYFIRRYKLRLEKFIRLFISSDDSIFYPDPKFQIPSSKFIIHWHGHIVPFHGLETIIKAAMKLKDYEDLEFRLITRFDSKYEKIKAFADSMGLTNIKFYPETSYEGLAKAINHSSVCLGVFGDNAKARVVIPNKIFEAIACGKPVITARHKALTELFTDQENILLCTPNNPQDLADKILFLQENVDYRDKIGHQALDLYKSQLTAKILGMKLLNRLKYIL